MLFFIAVLLGGGIALVRGGRLNNLAGLSVRYSALPLLALGLQIFVVYGPARGDARPFAWPALFSVASYGLLALAVAVNWRLPGMAWLGLGAALNLIVILANGGWMPVTPELLAQAGYISAPAEMALGQRFVASKDVVLAAQDIHLRWLSDVFVLPIIRPPVSQVFSLGDAAIMVGLFRLVQAGMIKQNK
jgi:hypothetical protein